MRAECLYSYEGNLYLKGTKKPQKAVPAADRGLGAGPFPSISSVSMLPDLYGNFARDTVLVSFWVRELFKTALNGLEIK